MEKKKQCFSNVTIYLFCEPSARFLFGNPTWLFIQRGSVLHAAVLSIPRYRWPAKHLVRCLASARWLSQASWYCKTAATDSNQSQIGLHMRALWCSSFSDSLSKKNAVRHSVIEPIHQIDNIAKFVYTYSYCMFHSYCIFLKNILKHGQYFFI